MVDANVRVQISKNNESPFEILSENSKNKDLKELIISLKDTQQKVNEFLTSLVNGEQNELTRDESDDLESGSDDSAEERVNPKKCKLSN